MVRMYRCDQCGRASGGTEPGELIGWLALEDLGAAARNAGDGPRRVYQFCSRACVADWARAEATRQGEGAEGEPRAMRPASRMLFGKRDG